MGKIIIQTALILLVMLSACQADEGKILKDFFKVSQEAHELAINCRPNDLAIYFEWENETSYEKQKKLKYKLNPNIANQEIHFMRFHHNNGKGNIASRENGIGKLTVLDEHVAQFNWLERDDYIIFRQINLLPTITKNPKNKSLFKKEVDPESDVTFITTPENIMVTDPFNHIEYRCKLEVGFD